MVYDIFTLITVKDDILTLCYTIDLTNIHIQPD